MTKSVPVPMNERGRLIHVNCVICDPKEYKGQRVVTFKDIDLVHGRAEGTARKRFSNNKERFIEGVDYFVRKTDEAKKEYGITAPNGLFLLTESGYLMLVKSFTDDTAWTVQRELVNHYFRRSLSSIPRFELGKNTKELIKKARKEMITLEMMLDVIEGNSDRVEKERCRHAITIFSRGLGANILDLAQIRLEQ